MHCLGGIANGGQMGDVMFVRGQRGWPGCARGGRGGAGRKEGCCSVLLIGEKSGGSAEAADANACLEWKVDGMEG